MKYSNHQIKYIITYVKVACKQHAGRTLNVLVAIFAFQIDRHFSVIGTSEKRFLDVQDERTIDENYFYFFVSSKIYDAILA